MNFQPINIRSRPTGVLVQGNVGLNFKSVQESLDLLFIAWLPVLEYFELHSSFVVEKNILPTFEVSLMKFLQLKRFKICLITETQLLGTSLLPPAASLDVMKCRDVMTAMDWCYVTFILSSIVNCLQHNSSNILSKF